jgi:hypothetical protein
MLAIGSHMWAPAVEGLQEFCSQISVFGSIGTNEFRCCPLSAVSSVFFWSTPWTIREPNEGSSSKLEYFRKVYPNQCPAGDKERFGEFGTSVFRKPIIFIEAFKDTAQTSVSHSGNHNVKGRSCKRPLGPASRLVQPIRMPRHKVEVVEAGGKCRATISSSSSTSPPSL